MSSHSACLSVSHQSPSNSTCLQFSETNPFEISCKLLANQQRTKQNLHTETKNKNFTQTGLQVRTHARTHTHTHTNWSKTYHLNRRWGKSEINSILSVKTFAQTKQSFNFLRPKNHWFPFLSPHWRLIAETRTSTTYLRDGWTQRPKTDSPWGIWVPRAYQPWHPLHLHHPHRYTDHQVHLQHTPQTVVAT